MDTKRVGVFGEKIAEDYLKNKGYQILDKNYSFRIPGNPQKGEIDIVAKKADIISFVEVKTLLSKGTFSPISPEEKVGFWKQKKLVRTAENWLMEKKIPLDSKWQIDIISIKIEKGKTNIAYFPNAVPFC